ncbi:uncharacterized protein LOC131663119 [Phymastichus coffea]|uniref:uncharacterized protein LOC131663119 n=1 Tax=Phymastichus coffea TaxID=108790 RepID=UPI00273B00F5|nr:uncharacterized protein LOC131663119 [Phymastichus coffea]XP_058789209.1 uncharacterized protein LOC131663119 [Phymastichus coffea]
MLALLLRGVFLLGVIGWYSASLWKVVDNYFKGQFQRYLEEEYQRNPRMRDDVRAYTTADKAASDVIAGTTQQRLAEISPRYPIDKAELVALEVKSQESGLADFEAGAAEIEVARPAHTDQPVFHDSPVDATMLSMEMPSPSPEAIRDYQIDESSNFSETERAEKTPALERKPQQEMGEMPKEDEKQSSPHAPKKTKAKKRPKIIAKSEVTTERKIKQRLKIPMLQLTEDDFEDTARFFEFGREDDYRDFIDDFEADNEDFDGISLKDLPFKPMIDVYDLERISEEEYCPLSLDDDPTCDELQFWP